jgi:hypothetical protein
MARRLPAGRVRDSPPSGPLVHLIQPIGPVPRQNANLHPARATAITSGTGTFEQPLAIYQVRRHQIERPGYHKAIQKPDWWDIRLSAPPSHEH